MTGAFKEVQYDDKDELYDKWELHNKGGIVNS
jgi:hypothetical protein